MSTQLDNAAASVHKEAIFMTIDSDTLGCVLKGLRVLGDRPD